jgi:hypothetical protein
LYWGVKLAAGLENSLGEAHPVMGLFVKGWLDLDFGLGNGHLSN